MVMGIIYASPASLLSPPLHNASIVHLSYIYSSDSSSLNLQANNTQNHPTLKAPKRSVLATRYCSD